MYTKSQKLVAEFIGTFALIFFGAGSICADQFLHSTGQGGPGASAGRMSRPASFPPSRRRPDLMRTDRFKRS